MGVLALFSGHTGNLVGKFCQQYQSEIPRKLKSAKVKITVFFARSVKTLVRMVRRVWRWKTWPVSNRCSAIWHKNKTKTIPWELLHVYLNSVQQMVSGEYCSGLFKGGDRNGRYVFSLWQASDAPMILTQQTKWFEGRHVCHLCGAHLHTLLPHKCRIPPPPPLRSARTVGVCLQMLLSSPGTICARLSRRESQCGHACGSPPQRSLCSCPQWSSQRTCQLFFCRSEDHQIRIRRARLSRDPLLSDHQIGNSQRGAKCIVQLWGGGNIL